MRHKVRQIRNLQAQRLERQFHVAADVLLDDFGHAFAERDLHAAVNDFPAHHILGGIPERAVTAQRFKTRVVRV